EGGRRVVIGGSLRREQIRDDRVPAAVVVELLRQPRSQGVGAGPLYHQEVIASHEQVAPDGAEMLPVLRAVQQFVDQLASLVGILTVEESNGLLVGRDASRQVKGDAAQELGVIG